MAKVSKELNSILNENKDPAESNKKSSSSSIFILLLLVTVVAIYFATLYFSNMKSDNSEITNQDIKYKKIIEKNIALSKKNEKIQKELSALKSTQINSVQKETKPSKEITQNIENNKKLQEENKKIKEQLISLKNELQKKNNQLVATPTKEIKKSIIDKAMFTKVYFTKKSKSYKCYNFPAGEIFIPNDCLTKLKVFLDNNKDALRYQIIPVLDKNDKEKYKKFEKEYQNLLLSGLSSKRVSEVVWGIKKLVNHDIILTSNSYYLESKKGSGFILKAHF